MGWSHADKDAIDQAVSLRSDRPGRGPLPLVALTMLVAFWLAPPAAAAQPAPAAPLIITVETKVDSMMIAKGKRIPVIIGVKDEAGRGVPGLALQLDATAGTLSGLKDRGKGRYTATYGMPKRLFPQAVVLAAWLPGSPPGWKVIRLRSSVKLPVTTTKPRVEVTLTISGRTYGPTRSDARGEALIPVEVHPGETEAQVTAVDEFGNRKQRRVEIPMPRAPTLIGFTDRQKLAADGQDFADIYLLSIRPDGTPADALEVLSTRQAGKLSPATKIQAGLYRLRFTAPAGLSRTRTSLILADKAEPEVSKRSFDFDLVVGKPARLNMNVKPKQLVADGQTPTIFTITITDAGTNPVRGLKPTLHCHRGTVVAVRELGEGKYEGRWVVPPQLSGDIVCRASLSSAGSAWLEDQVNLSLAAPTPDRIESVAVQTELPLDGRSRTRIDIHVWDRAGNPLEGVVVRATAAAGGLDAVSEDGQGAYHVSFTAPTGERETRVRVQVVAGEGDQAVRDDAIIQLKPIVLPPPPTPWLAVGLAGTFTSNFTRVWLAGLSLEVVARLPGLADTLYLSLDSGYRHGSDSTTTSLGGQSVDVELDVFPLHLNILLKPLPRSLFSPVIGLGGGAQFVQWGVRGPTGASERGRQVLLSSLVTLGGEFHLGPGDIFLHLRYSYAFLDDRGGTEQADAGSGSHVVGSVGGLDVHLGYRLNF